MNTWDRIDAVQRMQEYILKHIDEEITLRDLGRAAGYSPYHSIRIFKTLTGTTPFEYIRALRLTNAAQKLVKSDEKVVDVALKVGFESHDGFTRAFYRQFDITPIKYRSEKPPVNYFVYYPVRSYYRMIEKTPENERSDKPMERISATVAVTPAERPARKLILLRSKNAVDYLSYCNEMGCGWEGLLNSIPERFENAALLTLPARLIRSGESSCAAGVEVPADYSKPIPEGYDAVELPPCSMLYFQGMPFDDENDFCQAISIVMEAIGSYRPETYGYAFDYELAPRFNFGASAKEGARMAVPAKRIV